MKRTTEQFQKDTDGYLQKMMDSVDFDNPEDRIAKIVALMVLCSTTTMGTNPMLAAQLIELSMNLTQALHQTGYETDPDVIKNMFSQTEEEDKKMAEENVKKFRTVLGLKPKREREPEPEPEACAKSLTGLFDIAREHGAVCDAPTMTSRTIGKEETTE